MAYIGQTEGNANSEALSDSGTAKNGKPPKQSGTSGLSVAVTVLCYIGYGLILLANPRGGTGAKILAMGIFLIAAPIGVGIGGLIGNLICPTFILARGAQELLWQRLFWWVGPRFIGAGIAAVVATLLAVPEIIRAL